MIEHLEWSGSECVFTRMQETSKVVGIVKSIGYNYNYELTIFVNFITKERMTNAICHEQDFLDMNFKHALKQRWDETTFEKCAWQAFKFEDYNENLFHHKNDFEFSKVQSA